MPGQGSSTFQYHIPFDTQICTLLYNNIADVLIHKVLQKEHLMGIIRNLSQHQNAIVPTIWAGSHRRTENLKFVRKILLLY
jgi:uncharacterized membrane protein